MDQPLFHRNDTAAPTASEPQEERRDQVPDAPTSTNDDAAASRHLYTMTVDDVAEELIAYELHRDTRTIQRWCKSGKLRSILDEENGDRYLIDPGSVRETVTTLLEERDSRAPRHATAPRPRHDGARAARRHGDDAPTQFQFTPRSMTDTERDAATDEPTPAAASDTSRDEVAALKAQIAELEKEKAMLSVDKQVREQMVDYLKENFQQMLDQALDRTEQLGQLQAENKHLRALLPQQTERPPEAPSYRDSGAGEPPPQAERYEPPAPESTSMHRRTPWAPQ